MSKSDTLLQVAGLLREHKAWWLAPIVFVFLAIGVLLVATQGSALSQLVAEMVMADVLRGIAVPPGVRLVTYADNIGIVMPGSCKAVIEELFRGAFERHSAGPFQLTFTDAIPVTQGFDFLGLSFFVEEGKPRATVLECVWGKWLTEIGGEVLVASATELQDIERKVRGKIAQWRMWSGADALEAEALTLIASAKEALSLTERRISIPTAKF